MRIQTSIFRFVVGGSIQLNYGAKKMAAPTGLKPVTNPLEGECSIQLSYGAVINCFSATVYKTHAVSVA